MFPDDKAKLSAGRISYDERALILDKLGKIAQTKYDEFLMQGARQHNYRLEKIQGSLKFEPDIFAFDNIYYLQGKDKQWTDIANYFEYGTGIYNTKRAGKYRAGYIKAKTFNKKLVFEIKNGKNAGKIVATEKVKGVKPIFAMTKAIKYVEFNRPQLQRNIRLELQND